MTAQQQYTAAFRAARIYHRYGSHSTYRKLVADIPQVIAQAAMNDVWWKDHPYGKDPGHITTVRQLWRNTQRLERAERIRLARARARFFYQMTGLPE